MAFFDVLVPEREGEEELDAVVDGGWGLDNEGSLCKALLIYEKFLSLGSRVGSEAKVGSQEGVLICIEEFLHLLDDGALVFYLNRGGDLAEIGLKNVILIWIHGVKPQLSIPISSMDSFRFLGFRHFLRLLISLDDLIGLLLVLFFLLALFLIVNCILTFWIIEFYKLFLHFFNMSQLSVEFLAFVYIL